MKAARNRVRTPYTRDGVACVPAGIATSTVWFAGGRTGVSVADHGGIEEMVYYGRQPLGRQAFFRSAARSAYPKVFRPYLIVDGKAYLLELRRTRIYPSGYCSTLAIPEAGVKIEHWLVAVNDAVLQTIKVAANRGRRTLRMRTSVHNYNRTRPDGRTWTDWKRNRAGAWTAEAVDEANGGPCKTFCAVVADRALSMKAFHSQKIYFETEAFLEGAVTTAVLFGHDAGEFRTRLKALRRGASGEAQAVAASWAARLKSSASLEGLSPAVASFFRQQPLVVESLMVRDAPGAMRASAGHYWVWGWDTMVHGDSYCLGGCADFVREALDLYERTADPEKGIAHAFRPDFTISLYQALAAQGLYAIWLYHYLAHTGDLGTVRRHYAFARTLFQRTLKVEWRGGLCEGRSLFPDFPDLVGHNGHDISVFNNGIFYQTARCMEYLATEAGDLETAASARRTWMELERNFRRRFWDARKGYWVDSLDSRDDTKRRSYPSYALLWVTPFARELVAGREAKCAEFMARHLAFPAGCGSTRRGTPGSTPMAISARSTFPSARTRRS